MRPISCSIRWYPVDKKELWGRLLVTSGASCEARVTMRNSALLIAINSPGWLERGDKLRKMKSGIREVIKIDECRSRENDQRDTGSGSWAGR